MAKLFTRATVSGATLSGASLKAALTTLWDALNSIGVTDASRSTVTTSATLLSTQCGLLLVDATSASIVLTLPTSGSAADDLLYTIRRIDASAANSVTVVRGGTDTIEGATTAILVPPGASTEIQMPGGATNWRILVASGGTAQGARNNISASDGPWRNRIINGNCFEDQRNVAAAQTIVAAAALAYCIDRFYAYCTGANATGQQIAAADTTKRYRFTGAASVTAIGFGHRIEAANSVDMNANVCTFSVKLSNSLLTTVSWAAYYANTADTFGTLASPTRTSIASGSFTVTSTEALYTAQINVPAAATTGIEIVLSVGAQISGTWTIGELQFERGAIPAAAIAFERVEVSMNRRRCQRYYEKSFSSTIAPAQNLGGTPSAGFGTQVVAAVTSGSLVGCRSIFKVPKRVAPTVTTLYNPGAANGQIRNTTRAADWSASAASIVDEFGLAIFGTTAAASVIGDTSYVDWTVSAEL